MGAVLEAGKQVAAAWLTEHWRLGAIPPAPHPGPDDRRVDGVERHRCLRLWLGAADIMLALPNAHVPWQGPHFAGSIYLDVNNVDEDRRTDAP